MKIRDILNELAPVEIVPETLTKSIINYNGKRMTFSQIPDKKVYSTVKFILSKLTPQERQRFASDDTGTWDIVFKSDGTVVITDDYGKSWSKIIKERK